MSDVDLQALRRRRITLMGIAKRRADAIAKLQTELSSARDELVRVEYAIGREDAFRRASRPSGGRLGRKGGG